MFTKEQILQAKWYRQSGALTPITLNLAFEGVCLRMHKYSGLRLANLVGAFIKTDQGYAFYNYFNYEDFAVEFNKILDKHAMQPGFFRDLHAKMMVRGQDMDVAGQAMMATQEDDKAFVRHYQDFLQASYDFWGYGGFLDALDPFEDKILDYIFSDRKQELTIRQINALTCADELSHIQKEQQDLLAIYRQAEGKGMTPEIQELVIQHAKRYWWIQNNFETARLLGPEYFIEELKAMLAEPEIADHIRLSLDKFEEARRNRDALIAELDLDRQTRERLAFFNWIINFRDDRKYLVQKCNYYLLQAKDRIASIAGVDPDLLLCAIPSETLALLQGDKSSLPELETRQGRGLLLYGDLQDKMEIISGQAAIDWKQIFGQTVMATEIRGSTASLGRATGTVRIILSEQDFPKLQEGDILVAPMTRPEYVPIMKKAVAIITDEGGLTCHAAIVSRELGIPCIIGTQVATGTLKDGEVIEVDANHSIIKIIKN